MLASAVVRFDYHANADGATTKGRVFEFPVSYTHLDVYKRQPYYW